MKKEIARVTFCDETAAEQEVIAACALQVEAGDMCVIDRTYVTILDVETYIRNMCLDYYIGTRLGINDTSAIFAMRVELQISICFEEVVTDNGDGTYNYYLFQNA